MKITHRQLFEIVRQLAGGLYIAGIQKGDRMGVLAQNCLEFVYLFATIIYRRPGCVLKCYARWRGKCNPV